MAPHCAKAKSFSHFMQLAESWEFAFTASEIRGTTITITVCLSFSAEQSVFSTFLLPAVAENDTVRKLRTNQNDEQWTVMGPYRWRVSTSNICTRLRCASLWWTITCSSSPGSAEGFCRRGFCNSNLKSWTLHSIMHRFERTGLEHESMLHSSSPLACALLWLIYDCQDYMASALRPGAHVTLRDIKSRQRYPHQSLSSHPSHSSVIGLIWPEQKGVGGWGGVNMVDRCFAIMVCVYVYVCVSVLGHNASKLL